PHTVAATTHPSTATGKRMRGVRKRITMSTLMCFPCAVAIDAPRSATHKVSRVTRPGDRNPPTSVSVDALCSQLRTFEKYSTPAFAQNLPENKPTTTAIVTGTAFDFIRVFVPK